MDSTSCTLKVEPSWLHLIISITTDEKAVHISEGEKQDTEDTYLGCYSPATLSHGDGEIEQQTAPQASF